MARRFCLLFVALAALSASALSQVMPPNSQAHGKSLNQWLSLYWQWYYATGGTTVFQPFKKPIVFLPIPMGTAEEPQGVAEVTLKAGTSFVLPVFAWVIERYLGYPDVADDAFFSFDTVRSMATYPGNPDRPPEVTLDGKPILTDFWDYYQSDTMFPAPVEYPEPSAYGSTHALGYQGVGAVYRPLPPGTHTLHIYEQLKLDPYFDVTYDNVWIIHVVP